MPPPEMKPPPREKSPKRQPAELPGQHLDHRTDRYPPWYPEVPLTDDQVTAIRATAGHLLGLGLTPLFRLAALRELWHHDPDLALTLARLRGAA